MPSWEIRVGDCRDLLAELEPGSVDAIVTDPPYELGFMGRAWDASGIAYQPIVWERALAALKPGGHLLAFGGTRTYHRMACAIEDAGFDVRDSIHWTYGSGFPKSLDVGKSIDKQRDDRDQVLRVTAWIAAARDAAGITNADIDQAFGFSGMAGHWTSQKSQPSVPTLEQVPRLLEVLNNPAVPKAIAELLIDLNGKKGQPGAAWFLREVTGTKRSAIADPSAPARHTIGASKSVEVEITAPATDAAKQWNGWGTALKPSHEPIVVARKPLEGTVAANVQAHGTGAINVDGCRVATGDIYSYPHGPGGASFGVGGGVDGSRTSPAKSHDGGRWPPNTVMTHAHECQRHKCAPGCPVPLLGDEAVFFPAFFYHPKAGRDEREAGLGSFDEVRRTDGRITDHHVPNLRTTARANHHPTVKPLGLMQWLCRLVTPPHGLVLDPFSGSGSTGCGAVVEGFRYLGLELSPEYAEIARARLSYWAARPTGGLSADEARRMDAGVGSGAQIGLFGLNKE